MTSILHSVHFGLASTVCNMVGGSPDAKGGHGGLGKTGNSFNFKKKIEIFRLVPPQNPEILVPLASGLHNVVAKYFLQVKSI